MKTKSQSAAPPPDTTYNGWKNYETWATNLWLTNEEPSYRHWTERARYWSKAPSTSQHWTQPESAKFNLADELKAALDDEIPDIGASLWSDLLRSAFDEIDWHEVAEAFLEGVE